MKNTCPFYIILSSFEGTSYKNLQDSHQIFYLLSILLAFTPADIIFHKFLELHSALSEKKISVTNFPFLSDYLKPRPPQQPKSTNRDKSFLSMLHNLSRFLKIIML